MICKKCNFDNYEGTKYCQGCGTYLQVKKPFFSFANLKFLSGWQGRGVTHFPLMGMAVEGHANQIKEGKASGTKVPVVPHEDGSWYCPDCGQYNRKKDMFCIGCGRDR